MLRDVRPRKLTMRPGSFARVNHQYRNYLSRRQQLHSVIDGAGGFPGSVPSNDDPPPETGEVSRIRDDQYRATGRKRNLLRTRSERFGFIGVGIELTKNGKIGVAGVEGRIGVRPLRNFPPFSRHTAKAG